MELVNLTPHPITLHRADGTVRTIAPEPTPARVATTTREIGEIDGIPLVEEAYEDVTGLPPPQPDTVYVVARVVAEHNPHRGDLVAPGNLIRDDQGRPIGARALVRITSNS